MSYMVEVKITLWSDQLERAQRAAKQRNELAREANALGMRTRKGETFGDDWTALDIIQAIASTPDHCATANDFLIGVLENEKNRRSKT